MNTSAAVEMRNIHKRFGSVLANNDVSLDINRGEILALLGENGSGKTTLMNMLAGIYFPDSGTIRVNGEPVVIASPKEAFELGIGMIHQHFKLVDVLSAAENIVLGLEGKLDLKSATKKIREICDAYGFDVNPSQKIYDMSVSQKQTVEIVKVLYRGADILILDEPTAVLTPQETDKLFAVLRNMRDDGKAIVIITHKLNEVQALSDKVAVLRGGRYIGTLITKDTNAQEMTDMMVGRAVSLNIDRPDPVDPQLRLEIRDLTVRNEEGLLKLDHVSFDANSGEILGIAGISGAGQKELLEAIYGLQGTEEGTVIFHDPETNKAIDLKYKTPMQIRQLGVSLSFVPEDRLGMGLVGSMDITDNMMLRSYRSGPHGFYARGKHSCTPAVRRKCTEGSGRPGNRPNAQSADDGISGTRTGHQLFLHNLPADEPAERKRSCRDLCGRGPGRADGTVRPDSGSVRRKGQRYRGRPESGQAADRLDDDQGGR